MTKASIRRLALAKRDALSPDERLSAARAVAERALPTGLATAGIVAGYSPIRSEFDPHPLMRVLSDAGMQSALPAVTARDAPLNFRAWQPGQELARGAFGILQPANGSPTVLPDIVLVPLAAFDRRGHRIGYGAGFYDRSLAQLRAIKQVVAIGLAFSVQEVAEVPSEIHDVPLDLVLTERETLDFRSI